MIPLDTLAVFFSASLLLALAPGPDNIFVLTQSALHGPLAGLVVTLGLCTGLVFHTLAVALGVAAVFQASAVAFTALKLLGVGYLAYLAWGSFSASAAELSSEEKGRISRLRLYQRGILMNISNPKVAIFFLAFLPQFADPSRGSLGFQIVLLGLVFILSAIIVFSVISLTAGFVGERLRRSPRVQILMSRIAGTVYAGLALRLAVTQR